MSVKRSGVAPPCALCGKGTGVRRWVHDERLYCRGCAVENNWIGNTVDFERDAAFAHVQPPPPPVDDHRREHHERMMMLSSNALDALENATKMLRAGETASVLKHIEEALTALRERDIVQNTIRALTSIGPVFSTDAAE